MLETKILDGKALSKEIELDLKEKIKNLKAKYNKVPKIATILVGDNPASVTYVRMKCRACERIGMEYKEVHLSEKTTTSELLDVIKNLNEDEDIDGILLQHPVPSQIDEQVCFDTIDVKKDVDGVSSISFGKMCNKEKVFVSATPCGIMKIIKHYNIEVAGKKAVVIGRSAILGKPVAMLLLNENATVSICHSKTKDLKKELKTADIVVACVGKPKFVKKEWLKRGVVLIDAGYNEGNIGDIDLDNAKKIASAYTPVPGGVGPMTIASLLSQTLESFLNKIGEKNG